MRTTLTHVLPPKRVALTLAASLAIACLVFACAPLRPVAAARQVLAARVKASKAVETVLSFTPAPIRRAINNQLAQPEPNKATGVAMAGAAMFAPVTITKDAIPASGSAVTQGQIIAYTIQATNGASSDTTTGAGGFIRIVDGAPAGTLFTSAIMQQQPQFGSAWSCTILGGGTSIQCSAGDDTGGGVDTFTTQEFVRIRAEVTVQAATANGTTLTNTATYQFERDGTGGLDGTSTSNTITHTVSAAAANADLAISKQGTPVVDPDGAGPLAPVALPIVGPNVPPGSVNAGGYIRYDLPFGNNGPADAVNVLINDQIPGNTAFVGAIATGGVFVPATQPPANPFIFTTPATDTIAPIGPAIGLSCTVTGAPGSQSIYCRPQGNTMLAPPVNDGTLPAGYTGTLTFFVRVNESVTGGTISSNPAKITSGLCPNGAGPAPPPFPPVACSGTSDSNTANNTTLPTQTVVIATSTLTISKIVQSAVTTASNPNQTGPLGPASPSGGTATTAFGTLIALSGNNLLRINPVVPTVPLSTTPITGLVAGDTIVGVDSRPATGELYALGANVPAATVAHLYRINTTTGAATQVGGNITLPQSTGTIGTESAFGFDFNPTVDRIRVTAPNGDNFRLNPDTGAVAGADTVLTPAGSSVVGAAYDRNFASATMTTLFGINSQADTLVRIGGVDGTPSPNLGVVTTIGPLGVNTDDNVGFDIVNDASGTAYASLTVGGVPGLYTINLTTGAATLVGALPAGVTDITAGPSSTTAVGVVPGTTLTYRVTVTNTGPSDVANVRFTDFLPSGLETPPGRVLGVRYVSVNQVGGNAVFTCSAPTGVPVSNNPQNNGGQVSCTAPLLSANAPNNVAIFDVMVFIDPATKAPLFNRAAVDATTNNFNQPVSATTALTTAVTPTSDLVATKSLTNAAGVVNGPVTAGTTFTYTVTLSNNGPSAAQMARLVDTFPAFQRVTNIAIAQTPDENGAPNFSCTATPTVGTPGVNTTSVVCTAAELPPNRRANGTVNPAGTVTFTFTVVQDPITPQPVTPYMNCVTATSMSFDPNTANSTNVCLPLTVAFQATLSGTKTDTPDPVIAGNLLTFTITATNNGPSAALNFRITDPLPTGTVFIAAVASPGASLTTPAVGTNGIVTAVWDAAGGTPGGLTPPGVTRTLTIVVRVCPDFQQQLNLTDAQMCVPNLTNTATITSDTPTTAPATATSVTTVQAQSDLSITKSGPANAPFSTTSGPSNVTYTLTFANAGPSNANGVTITDILPKGFTVVGTPTSTVPGTTFTTTTTNGISTLVANLGVLGAANQCVLTRPTSGTITVIARVPIKNPVQTVTNTATIATTNCLADPNLANNTASASTFIFDPGAIGQSFPAASEVSDQKAGSVLFFPIYTSDVANVAAANTRISLTNVSSTERVAVHLFAVDGTSCAVLDAFICLTPNQTTTFLASEVDPGNTGYIMAVAVDYNTGLPRSFNCLIGDEFVKFASGHRANLGAEAISAVMNFPAGLDNTATTSTLRFDGMFYNRLPRILALDSVGSLADGNSTMLILNRVGGNFLNGGDTIGNLVGLLYNDQEVSFSFTARADVCQLRQILSTTFPRTFPPINSVIPGGRTGWIKLFAVEERALFGAAIVANATVNSSPNAYTQGHNLHKLTLTDAATITLPLFPPSCSF